MQPRRKQLLRYKLILTAVLLIAFALRVYHLQTIPNGLFIDEAARGYDAFSISQTGADMFGARWPLFLRGFDDYTAGLYVYLTVPLVYFLHLSPFSTRFASVMVGLLTVAVAYQAIKRPFGRNAALAGTALVAVSPWYILLSRIGTEWNLLALGPMLTIVLAWRGLRRPRWLVAAGVAGGISLYGYAPVKAFLPLLLGGFALFYWRDLVKQRWATLTAAVVLALFALPVYLFSFTDNGLTRFQEIASFYNLGWRESAVLFVKNYFAYLDPFFLFTTDVTRPNIFFIQRFKNVGLLHWFELPLIMLGLVQLFRLGKRDRYFWLYWLLVAPVGINLHVHSPKPALWLTATPTLHGLAGAGLIYLFDAARCGFATKSRINVSLQRGAAVCLLAGLAIVAVINIQIMLKEIFVEFPVYAASGWKYGVDEGVKDLLRLQPAFDQANVDILGGVAGIYVAFYTQFSPQERHTELEKYGENAWQRVGPLTIGGIEARSLEPGCHLTLTRQEKQAQLPAPSLVLATYTLPNGQPSPRILTAIASPQSNRVPVQAAFGDKILLADYALASAKFDNALEMEPGQAICLVLLWQSAGNLPADYTAFVHLVGPANPATGGPLWAQHDGMPAGGQRPTTTWQPGETVQDMHVLFIPTDAPPGTYQLNAGLYDAVTGQRLPVQGNAEQVTLAEIKVR